MSIHPTAIIDPRAVLHSTVQIGGYVVIDGPVRIGAGTSVAPFSLITGLTEIGNDCRIHGHAVIGDVPQDRAFGGDETYCRIGDGCIIREGVTIHRGTEAGTATIVGNRCFIMANAHVGHNCVLEDDVMLVNGALLGGHVTVGSQAIISGNAAVHQFVRIGELAMIGGLSKITQDVPPFLIADRDGLCVGVNVVGLRRAGFSREERAEVQLAYRMLYRTAGGLRQCIENLDEAVDTEPGRRMVRFLRDISKRGISAGPVARMRVSEIEA
jgi:UDP-N-acetylglucosamine acyltransferase